MVRYRRNRVPDGTYFFNVTRRNRRSDVLVRHIDALREAWRSARSRTPHEVIAGVVLPDHLHAVVHMREAVTTPGFGRTSRKALRAG
jgi:putative transposase